MAESVEGSNEGAKKLDLSANSFKSSFVCDPPEIKLFSRCREALTFELNFQIQQGEQTSIEASENDVSEIFHSYLNSLDNFKSAILNTRETINSPQRFIYFGEITKRRDREITFDIFLIPDDVILTPRWYDPGISGRNLMHKIKEKVKTEMQIDSEIINELYEKIIEFTSSKQNTENSNDDPSNAGTSNPAPIISENLANQIRNTELVPVNIDSVVDLSPETLQKSIFIKFSSVNIQDKNECYKNEKGFILSKCDLNFGKCHNRDGSFSCKCDFGTMDVLGDGRMCAEQCGNFNPGIYENETLINAILKYKSLGPNPCSEANTRKCIVTAMNIPSKSSYLPHLEDLLHT